MSFYVPPMSLVHALTAYECDLPMRRVGRPHDGGYVIVDGLKYDHFLSGGISGDNSFERGILDLYPDLVCEAFDPVPSPGEHHARYHFTQRPIPGPEEIWTTTGAQWLVKLDIERNEWPWLRDLSIVSPIAQLVIELHSPHVPEANWSWKDLAILSETHALVHFHANNWDGIVEVDGVRMPGTCECTYVRRDLVGELRKNTQPIPGPLDMPNDASKPDHVIDWPPFVWGK